MNKTLAAAVPILVAIVLIFIVLKVIGALLGLVFKVILIAAIAGGAYLAYRAVTKRIGGPGGR